MKNLTLDQKLVIFIIASIILSIGLSFLIGNPAPFVFTVIANLAITLHFANH